ncbi:MAG: ATP synthase subunit I [Clostridiales bacterium]|nr:ATP synthase subunit I [Clostridiales bacterium]MBP3811477.1 ATP synthase subunit I [Clostridiales bacterium]
MKNIDPAIKNMTSYIALATLIMSELMEAVFLIIGRWDLPVLFGNLLGAGVGILNFFLMGLGLQKALDKDEKDAKATVAFSHTMRFFLLALVLILAAVLDWFNLLAAVISLIMPTAAVYMSAMVSKKKGIQEEPEV